MPKSINSRYFSVPPAYNLHFIYHLIFYYFIFSIIAYIYSEIKKNVNPGSWSNIPVTLFTLIAGFSTIISFSSELTDQINKADIQSIVTLLKCLNCLTVVSLIVFLCPLPKIKINDIGNINLDKFGAYDIIDLLAILILIFFGSSIFTTIIICINIFIKESHAGFTLLFFSSFFYIIFLFLIYLIYAFKKLLMFKRFTEYDKLYEVITNIFYTLLGIHSISLIFSFLNKEYEDLSYIIINSYNYIIYWYIFFCALFIAADTLDAANEMILGIKSFFIIVTCALVLFGGLLLIYSKSTEGALSKELKTALDYKFRYAGINI